MASPEDTSLTDAIRQIDHAVARDFIAAQTGTLIKRWITEPHFEQYREAIVAQISKRNWKDLEKCFWEEIAFGTGGRRGPMAEYGSATINVG